MPWNAKIDPGQLENAILNLAINARDAMPDGGTVTVEISNATLDRRYAALHPDVTPGPYVLVAVNDTGTGMPPEVAAQAFDPFFTTKQRRQGNRASASAWCTASSASPTVISGSTAPSARARA